MITIRFTADYSRRPTRERYTLGWSVLPDIRDIMSANPLQLPPRNAAESAVFLNLTTLADIMRWGRDEIDETTIREVIQSLRDQQQRQPAP